MKKLDLPGSATCDWEVHKFGGASLANAELYRTVGDLLVNEAKGRGSGAIPTMAIVSAMGGMTDLLIKVVDSALSSFEEAKQDIQAAVERQVATLRELAPAEITGPIEQNIRKDAEDILSIVQSLRMIRSVPAVTMEVVTGYGEIWSAQTLFAYLKTKNVPTDWIDARNILVVKSELVGLGEKGSAATGGNVSPIIVVTGFVATTAEGVPTTLKRSGSDYSATIFAKLLEAGRVTMWKNTDGVYTADPRRVPEAFPIESLKYDEAMELAYFGAQVLHPSAMVPCIDGNIPVYVRNIFNPSFKGTVIQGRSPTLKDTDMARRQEEEEERKMEQQKGGAGADKVFTKGAPVIPIKGITSIDKVALVNLEGASLIGVPGVAQRFMAAMADSNINVLMITQASSEHSICVAVPSEQGSKALEALQRAFELELARSTVNSISLLRGMSVVAIIGEGMAFTLGTAATFMRALATAKVNVRAIAQGSSERQVAVVVNAEDATRALRAVHQAFTLSETVASVAIIGAGGRVGGELVDQLNQQKSELKEKLGLQVNVIAAMSSSKMIINDKLMGLDTSKLPELIENGVQTDLDAFTAAIESDINPHKVVIDCTSSEKVSEYYEKWLKAGIHVITPNKMAGSGDLGRYRRSMEHVKQGSAQWHFESSVGAALPIISTLRDLLQTGDSVKLVEGSLSGTMSYVLRTFSETTPFSEAVRQAVANGFSESDIRTDLSGHDCARKVVILARELGIDMKVEDVEVECLIPKDIMEKKYQGTREEINNAFGGIADLKKIDSDMLDRLKKALANNNVLRYHTVINTETGRASIKIQETKNDHPLYRLKADENLICFHTSRYKTSPLIVKGSAAGAELTASGVFSDLLRLMRTF
ncbi:hypothetical protein GUITHDRAFT_81950 [Guillardia theta CCMP2712]|uniref:ACT domain-containing protein n=1 Tax=Guillardia theta (strain CCMP2712) TaxID=905079 RepID=L1I9F7_GUITC|nr:hypothetical protein GUITHDRAFT_81950 [Guillardia theta CCMP2712]EKX32843.1 hypothetical protein GUITHDRAFT_81950 [Guillardia theta CCMP2712]|eukprot:XP_005819823.1 hypothetical protein GUITHDRAFT_81950 [Guillardia theta CCMP2712]